VGLSRKTKFTLKKAKIWENFMLNILKTSNEVILAHLFDGALQENWNAQAQKYLIKLNDMNRVVLLFNSWAPKGASHEKELFITRFILL